MPDIDPSVDAIVTDHCALRWLERVLDVEIGSIAAHGETERLNRLCRELGVSPLALKATILSPTVRAALNAGADKIQSGEFWITFAYGRVSTVLPVAMRYGRRQNGRGHKLREFSRQSPTRYRHRLAIGEEDGL